MARLVIFIANRDPNGITSRLNIAAGMSACYQLDMPISNCFTEIKWSVCKEKLNTLNYRKWRQLYDRASIKLTENRIIQMRQATCSRSVARSPLGILPGHSMKR